jgi:low affinity Fe/Cu permease
MQFNMAIGHFMYHRLDLKDLVGQLRSTQDHYIYVDTISFNAAGGTIALNGLFNGNDPAHIFLKPNLKISNIDLDKLLFKFENFGQDVILSENLHGKLNAAITGEIRVYPDFVVDLDQSEVHIDAQVLNGRLENYGPVNMLSDYFGDKDLTKIKFDTLQNHMDIIKGTLSIPTMTIESTLGHMDISGTQDMNNEIDYFVRIPMSVLMKATRNKVFGTKENDPEAVDKIITVDANKRTRYLNLNITGTLDDYAIKIGKDKK